MILRKPYAFFIKYFRLFNLIMAIFIGIIIYRTLIIAKFLSDYVKDYTVDSLSFTVSKYMNFYSFLFIFLIIALTIVVLSVIIVKKKPKKLYVINLIVYLATFVIYLIDYSAINTISNQILDFRISGALRDINYMLVIAQIISFILTLVRATGFDIKSFDFSTDLHALDIDTKDNEEFEVAVEFDRNKIKRDFRKKFRYLKYYYVEHKFVIFVSFVLIILTGCFAFFMNKNVYSANYKVGQNFNASGLILNINDSYIVQNDKDGNELVSKEALIVVSFDIKRVNRNVSILNTGLMTLEVDGKSYAHTSLYDSAISDLGRGYSSQKLSEDFETYLISFKIPSKMVNKSMVLKFNDNLSYVRGEFGAKNVYIKLKPKNLSKKTDVVETNLNDTVMFSGSILGDSSLRINNVSISDRFKVEYDFCSKKDRCYKSYEYITPTATGNYFKTLMRIEGEYEVDENLNLDSMDDLYHLLNTFGILNYRIDGKWMFKKINSEFVEPKVNKQSNITYVEVPKEVQNADSIYLSLNVRNYTYKYMLK